MADAYDVVIDVDLDDISNVVVNLEGDTLMVTLNVRDPRPASPDVVEVVKPIPTIVISDSESESEAVPIKSEAVVKEERRTPERNLTLSDVEANHEMAHYMSRGSAELQCLHFRNDSEYRFRPISPDMGEIRHTRYDEYNESMEDGGADTIYVDDDWEDREDALIIDEDEGDIKEEELSGGEHSKYEEFESMEGIDADSSFDDEDWDKDDDGLVIDEGVEADNKEEELSGGERSKYEDFEEVMEGIAADSSFDDEDWDKSDDGLVIDEGDREDDIKE